MDKIQELTSKIEQLQLELEKRDESLKKIKKTESSKQFYLAIGKASLKIGIGAFLCYVGYAIYDGRSLCDIINY